MSGVLIHVVPEREEKGKEETAGSASEPLGLE